MSDSLDILRLPERLFDNGTFSLPLKQSSYKPSTLRMRMPVASLEDDGLKRFIFAEFHGPGFEIIERRLLCRLLEDGGSFIDVGAHFGLYSLILADAVPDLHCLAVEPAADNMKILVENVAINGLSERIALAECALGDHTGIGHLRANSSMGSHLAGRNTVLRESDIPVSVQTLSALLESVSSTGYRSDPLWLKIDTEGREAAVLGGAEELFADGKVEGVLWEFRVGHLVNPDTEFILSFFKKYDFDSFEISDSNMMSVRGKKARNALAALGFLSCSRVQI